jgi:hypothetical protein
MAVVMMLALPVVADSPRDGRRNIVKVVKSWLVQIFGDGLIDPRP